IGQQAFVGLLRVDRFPAVHQLRAALVDYAFNVAYPDVFASGAHRHQKVETGECRSARARTDDLDVGQFLAVQEQRIGDRRADNDGRAMLVVVKHRDFHSRLELRLDFKAFRALDVLEVDPAKGGFKRGDGFDHALDRVGGDLDIEDVDP